MFNVCLVIVLSFYVVCGSVVNDELCDRQLSYFDAALDARDNWALFVFDTWAKFQSSVLRGFRQNPGGFTDCVNFRHESNLTSIGTFQGQHCFVDFKAVADKSDFDRDAGFHWRELGEIARDNDFNLRHGFCLPASCSSQKVLNYTNRFLSQGDFIGTATRCQTNDAVPFEALDIFAIVLFSFFGFLLAASTIYEVVMLKTNREINKLFIAFSAYTNGFKLYDVTISISPNNIQCLHGIRALSLLFIIFGHRYGANLGSTMNIDAYFDWTRNVHASVFHTHQVPVDVFFLMGGLLVTWSVLQSLDKNCLNLWRIYLHRYLRYTPLLAAIILFLVALMKHFVFGPFSYLRQRLTLVPNCEKWWWTTLLHVQNYVNPNEACLGHAWYLSIDFQLFLITPFLVYPAWKYGWKYLWTLPTLTLLSSIYNFVMSLVFKIYIVTKSPDAASFDFFVKWIYYPTHARMGPWFLGCTLGYILYQNRNKKIKLSPTINATIWIICLSVFTTITLGSFPMFKAAQFNETTLLANAFYLGFYRNGWALASAWMIFACHNGTGGIIRWFLELPQWQPIARMGLSMYLVSFIFQHFTVMQRKQPTYFDEFEWLHQYWGDIVGTIFFSTITYLVFETPFMLVENYLFKKLQKQNA